MKILHTSDWHLGHALYGRKRNEEFRLFLQWLLKTLQDEAVDVLLVSGDIFDSGLPSNQAQSLYYSFLCDAAKGPCRHVVITAGNHDSPSFLDAPQELLHALNVHVVGRALDPENEVKTLCDAQGRPELIVCAVPFLRDRDLFRARPGDTVDDREALLAQGMREHYRLCAERADVLREQSALRCPDFAPPPVVAMGHLFAAGGLVAEDDGVRDLRIGSIGQISADIFPPSFRYVALGHLHSPQKVNGQDRIRYSGSPLPMGFGEAGLQKKVCLAEFNGDDLAIRNLDVPLFQKLEKISGDLPAIEKRLAELSLQGESVWTEIVYQGTVISDLRERLLEKASDNVEILRIRVVRGSDASFSKEDEGMALEDMSVHEVFERLLGDLEREDKIDSALRESLIGTYSQAILELQDADKEEN